MPVSRAICPCNPFHQPWEYVITRLKSEALHLCTHPVACGRTRCSEELAQVLLNSGRGQSWVPLVHWDSGAAERMGKRHASLLARGLGATATLQRAHGTPGWRSTKLNGIRRVISSVLFSSPINIYLRFPSRLVVLLIVYLNKSVFEGYEGMQRSALLQRLKILNCEDLIYFLDHSQDTWYINPINLHFYGQIYEK